MQMLKPSSCEGCPFYEYGKYYVPDKIVPGSKVMFVLQNPGPDEEAGLKLVKRHWQGRNYVDEKVSVDPQPLIGATGYDFEHKYLQRAGLQRSEVSLGNAIRCRPGRALGLRSDDLPKLTTAMKLEHSSAGIVNALNHCRDTHLHIPDSVELVVAMGRYAMFALTGIQNEETEYKKKVGVVESWRGYGVDHGAIWGKFKTVDTSFYHSFQTEKRIFFMMHLAALNYGANKKYAHAALQDMHKIKRILQGTWPMPLPRWSQTPPETWPTYAAFDTEYNPEENDALIRWSLCDTKGALYCVEADASYGRTVPVEPGSTVLMQNALADIGHLANIIDMSDVTVEDLMLADSVLWTGEPHSLNYINSKYGAFNRYKHLSKDNPQLYSALDAYEPMHVWKTHYIPEFRNDKQSWAIYRSYRVPLISIIDQAQRTGAKVDTGKLTEVQHILTERLAQIVAQGKEITGDSKFNVGGSKLLKEYIYD
jgi:uracil-DNA glycosylase